MSKMTVLQKIIEKVKFFSGDEVHPINVIGFLEANLKAEQQQIRDAWGAATLYKKAIDYGCNDWAQNPDLETYIKTLTTKP